MKHYFKGYKFKAFVAVFFKFTEAAFEIILPLLMVSLIDDGILKGDNSVVYRMVMLMLVLTLLGYLASITCQYLASVISQRIGGRIRIALFEKISAFSMQEFDLFTESALANRVSVDVNAIQDMIARTIRLAVRAPMILIGSLVALYELNHELGTTLLKFVPVFILVIALFMYLSMRYHRQAQKSLDALSEKSKSLLDGSRIVRAFSREDYEHELFNDMNQKLAKSQRSVGVIAAISSPFTSFLMNGVLVLLVFLGAQQINVGSMTQGQMVALINYCTQLVLTLIVFMNLVMIFSRGYVSTLRLKEIFAIESTLEDRGETQLEEGPISIEFKDVNFSYPGEKRRVLKNLDFKIEAGMRVGFLGLTGSGKSTVVRLLMRLYDASSGTVLLNDTPIQNLTMQSLRDHVAYVSQSPQFLRGDLSDSILMGREGDALELLDIAQGRDISEKGLDAKIQSKGKNLSGGQRQRVSIARALAKPFGLLIFDDSFSALDMLTGARLRERIRSEYPQQTQIVISQRTQAVQDMDQIFVIDKGEIVDVGTHADLLASSELYRDVHALQAEVVS